MYSVFIHYGLVAQLGERRVRNAEVKGSNPSRSILRDNPNKPTVAFVGGMLVPLDCPAANRKAHRDCFLWASFFCIRFMHGPGFTRIL